MSCSARSPSFCWSCRASSSSFCWSCRASSSSLCWSCRASSSSRSLSFFPSCSMVFWYSSASFSSFSILDVTSPFSLTVVTTDSTSPPRTLSSKIAVALMSLDGSTGFVLTARISRILLLVCAQGHVTSQSQLPPVSVVSNTSVPLAAAALSEPFMPNDPSTFALRFPSRWVSFMPMRFPNSTSTI